MVLFKKLALVYMGQNLPVRPGQMSLSIEKQPGFVKLLIIIFLDHVICINKVKISAEM